MTGHSQALSGVTCSASTSLRSMVRVPALLSCVEAGWVLSSSPSSSCLSSSSSALQRISVGDKCPVTVVKLLQVSAYADAK